MVAAFWAHALLLALPLRGEAVRAAVAGGRWLPFLQHVGDDLPGKVPNYYIDPRPPVPEIVQQASASVTQETQPGSAVRDLEAAFVNDAKQASPTNLALACPSRMREPPVVFVLGAKLNFLDENQLPIWLETTPGCEEGNTLKTIQVHDEGHRRVKKMVSTTCQGGQCSSTFAGGDAVQLPERLRDWKDEGAVLSLVSKMGGDGAYEEVEWLSRFAAGREWESVSATRYPAEVLVASADGVEDESQAPAVESPHLVDKPLTTGDLMARADDGKEDASSVKAAVGYKDAPFVAGGH